MIASNGMSQQARPENLTATLAGGELTEISEADVGLLVNDKAHLQELVQSATLPLLENEEGQHSDGDGKLDLPDGTNKSEDLTWLALLWFYLVAIANGALGVAEYLGEKLADLFGITSSRYPYIMEEVERQRIRKQRAEAEAEEEVAQNEAAISEQLAAMEEGSASELDMRNGANQSTEGAANKLPLHPVGPAQGGVPASGQRSYVCEPPVDLTMDEVDLGDVGRQV